MRSKSAYVWTWGAGSEGGRRKDELAEEEPLEIRVDTRSVSVTMRTPGHDHELAAGFMFTEGLIRSKEDLTAIRPYARNRRGNVVDLFLAPDVEIDFARLTRHVFMSSSCGLCGKASIESVHRHFKPVEARMKARVGVLQRLAGRLTASQETFGKTGGLHAAGVFDGAGRLLVAREDVGRHNAVDKVLGHALLQGWLPLSRHILMVSGRTSFEIMQKSLAARIPVVAAISAPTSLAVRFARKNGQTLIGFLRNGRMNVYSGRERVVQ